MIDHIITAGVGISILALAYVIDLIVGIAKVMFTAELAWSWKKMVQDLVKAALISIGIVGFVVVLDLMSWFGSMAGADLSFLSAISLPALISAIIGGCAWYLQNAFSNIVKFINNHDVEVEVDETKADYAAISSKVKEIVADVKNLITPEKSIEKHKEFEESGGTGKAYVVPISSYDDFKTAVNGKGFNIDDWAGWQCWDGAALLWQQLGLRLITGNGAAIGCWDLKRDVNKYDKFDLVTDVSSLKRGDVVCMRPNHIGYFDGWNGNYMRILGQNQGGTPIYTQNGYTTEAFNVVNIAKSAFAGAFRYRGWITTTTTVTTTTVANPGSTSPSNQSTVSYTYRRGDTFGQVLLNLGLIKNKSTMWNVPNGEVARYTEQLREQGISGNIPIGKTIKLRRLS